eukprot:151051-Prorocentrum_minimum.AAC.1
MPGAGPGIGVAVSPDVFMSTYHTAYASMAPGEHDINPFFVGVDRAPPSPLPHVTPHSDTRDFTTPTSTPTKGSRGISSLCLDELRDTFGPCDALLTPSS